MNWKKVWKKTWYFIWESDSVASWIVNIILAFVLIKFVIYPGMGFAMQTSYPIVAVVSGSMEHKATHPCVDFNSRINDCEKFNKKTYTICGKNFETRQKSNLDFFWESCGEWYIENTEITKESFDDFKFKNGFNKGDIMVLRGKKPEKIEVGNTIVYMSKTAPYPIIHRVIRIENSEEEYTFITKGDHNVREDVPVDEEQLIGNAVLRVPFVGWIKIGFVNLINIFIGV
ncbi:signal peptidase I [Candidatus Woesearchaeota archaeon B3_Woes]|nr:MAG: signal peptidase I [Candidatus Woesearchaeota archaeon B3_Woes]